MRTHINKSLKTCCCAIQTALHKFNTAAKAINCPGLKWSEILTYGSLAEFALLHECREDICNLPWMDAANQQAALLTLKIERALEERNQLNIEVQCLVTAMHDEEKYILKHIHDFQGRDDLLAAELQDVLAYHMHMYDMHCVRIECIHSLKSYTGSCEPGIHIRQLEAEVELAGMASLMSKESLVDGDGASDGCTPDEDDHVVDELDTLHNFLGQLDSVAE